MWRARITSNSKSLRSWVRTSSVSQVFSLLYTRNMMNVARCILVTSLLSLKFTTFPHWSPSMNGVMWTVQNRVEQLSSPGAWETSNHIISSSLIRTPRPVPLLSILKKTIANVQWLTVEVANPRIVPAGLFCSRQTQAALSIPLPSLFARLFSDSLQQWEKIKLYRSSSRTWGITAVQRTAVDQQPVRISPHGFEKREVKIITTNKLQTKREKRLCLLDKPPGQSLYTPLSIDCVYLVA